MGMGRKPAPNRGCIATRGHRITLTIDCCIPLVFNDAWRSICKPNARLCEFDVAETFQ